MEQFPLLTTVASAFRGHTRWNQRLFTGAVSARDEGSLIEATLWVSACRLTVNVQGELFLKLSDINLATRADQPPGEAFVNAVVRYISTRKWERNVSGQHNAVLLVLQTMVSHLGWDVLPQGMRINAAIERVLGLLAA